MIQKRLHHNTTPDGPPRTVPPQDCFHIFFPPLEALNPKHQQKALLSFKPYLHDTVNSVCKEERKKKTLIFFFKNKNQDLWSRQKNTPRNWAVVKMLSSLPARGSRCRSDPISWRECGYFQELSPCCYCQSASSAAATQAFQLQFLLLLLMYYLRPSKNRMPNAPREHPGGKEEKRASSSSRSAAAAAA